ncbi:MAG: MFS transporter [Lachnospiraceae bacterium]|nr:MFS transporter [Lachnospiraceae bacterium]
MNVKYQKTMYACFIGYIVQAIVNNFVPLLFLTFESAYHIPLRQITMLITINFGIQLLVDLLSAGFVDKIGYRVSVIIAHFFSAFGLLGLVVLPEILPSAYAGLLISVTIYAIGGGLIEVLISPIMESCPTDNKERAMSLLHSFYCWGHVGVVLLSTLFFRLFGIENWKILTCIWIIVPVFNAFIFFRTPMAPLVEEGEKGMSMIDLCKNKVFWVLMLMMLCAGASEQSVSQWASTFAERGLGVSKTLGDLAGPMAFAVLMGGARAFYGKFGDRIDLDQFMMGSGILCMMSYFCISLAPSPFLSLIGCGICGLSVGIMWPGSFSKASASIKNGGTALFALLALAGDLGCSGGPTLVGYISSLAGDDLKKGILAAIMFPVLLVVGIILLKSLKIAGNERRHSD